ncbi:MAG: hypothetical protein JW904_14965 [Spirochaetales bacterium]|nr:hypothetical protein [Spirochaetales bacterium]
MIPPVEDPRWIKILKGEINHNFKAIAAGLMISRLSRSLKSDSSSKALKSYSAEMRSFFLKYEKVFNEDIKTLFGGD